MLCKECNGKGDYFNEVYNDGKRRREILVKCKKCNGTGEVEMTNEEWFCDLSIEEKAKFFVKQCADSVTDFKVGDMSKWKSENWIKWLKEKRNG